MTEYDFSRLKLLMLFEDLDATMKCIQDHMVEGEKLLEEIKKEIREADSAVN